MGLWISTLIVAAVVAIAFYFWERLPDRALLSGRRWFWIWVGKGLVAPALFWLLLNCGSAAWLPRIIRAKLSGKLTWILVMFWETAPGIIVIACAWLTLTLGWLVWNFLATHRDDWEQQKPIVSFWSLFFVPVMLLMLIVQGWFGLGLTVMFYFGVILYGLLAIEPRREAVPSYTSAIAKMKFGKFAEAEQDVIRELERCADDFDGWIMLAELYATRFGDFAEAAATIRDICNLPTTNPTQVSIALHRLADWQLKFQQDPVAARRSLAEISARFPNTHLAKMAQLRINQIPASKEEFLKQQEARTIQLAPLSNELDDEEPRAEEKLSERDAIRLANECVAKLKTEPNNVQAREKLARLLAIHLGQPEAGIEQVELLLKIPDQPEFKRAEWLACIAAWHLNLRGDVENGKVFLQRLVAEHPHSSQGFSAARKLNLLTR